MLVSLFFYPMEKTAKQLCAELTSCSVLLQCTHLGTGLSTWDKSAENGDFRSALDVDFQREKGPWRNVKPLLVGNTTNRSGNACANKPGRFVSMSQRANVEIRARALKLQTANLVMHSQHSTRFETNKNIQIMARCLHAKVVKLLLSR